MSLPDINFENIRPYDGSRHAGFEELCSQLAYLEKPSGSKFYRKGRGADAGVECYQQQTEGTEIGWQVKYLFSWDASLSSQLNDSIRTALDKHLLLVEYVVCLPFDLSDSRTGRGKTAREKWNEWCDKWKDAVSAEGRQLVITLWGKSEITGRLANDNAAYGGRLLYWFDKESFTRTWFVEQFEKARVALGTRYTPETNVELPIRHYFLAFARDQALQKQLDRWFIRVTDEGHSAVRAIRKSVTAGSTEAHSDALLEAVRILAAALGSGPIGTDQLYPLDKWRSALNCCRNFAREALRWVYDLPSPKREGPSTEPKQWAQHNLYKILDVLSDIEDAINSPYWQLANARAVLLTGPAGIGKSHLLADIVEFQINEGQPAILVLGSTFTDNEPWRQILNQLDRPTTEQIKHFLGSMDAAAQAAGERALICIDALNERNGIDVWPHWLASFLKIIEAFPRIGVILSCRSTYIPYVIPDNLGVDQLYRVEHEGFAADGGKAAKVYLDKRGIVRPGAPNLVPEFENPLFLKTCCDFLDKEGKNELPRGLRGVTSIFGFYNEAVIRALNQRMKLDPHYEIIPKAIAGFALLLANAGKGYIEKNQAVALFESIRPSGGGLDKSLLSQLESEGLLTIEPIWQDDGVLIEMVRFTFERFSDHTIAAKLFRDHLKNDDVMSSFLPNQPLYEFIFGPRSYKHAGIIEAMAVQLPEQTGVEILDVGESENKCVVHQAFLESLLWRDQSHFTDRTFELARELLSPRELSDRLISISTEPFNKFNARFIHTRLIKMSMSERDAFWSVYVAEKGYEGEIEILISWALNNGMERIDEDRVYLSATMLAWFFTTSHRVVRDKATKSLACILSPRLPLAVRLLNDFATVNDPYVLERLLSACYGAALQGSDSGLSELAQTVFDLVFANGKPPVDALVRDHAHGIIEFAKWRGTLASSLDTRITEPPYISPWPIEAVPDELIASYTPKSEKDIYSGAIVRSTIDGDFAHYVLDYTLNKWSPAPLGTATLPSLRNICDSWIEEFSSSASVEQLGAFRKYLRAAEAAQNIPVYQEKPETVNLVAAETALKVLMTSEQWEDFRVRAKGFIRHQLYSDWYQDQPATFNVAWARRWVCKRAHEYGWKADLFKKFESHNRNYDRTDHRVERIGKKYQWLALRELLARMADNLSYIGSNWNCNGKMPVYRGARQIGLRDIDPSLLTTGTHYDGWAEWGRTWWVPFNPELRPMSPHERRAWLESASDIINDASLIDLRNPKTGRRWLQLSGFSHWKGTGVRDGRKEFQRDTWFRLNCIVVRRSDQAALFKGLQNQILTDPDSLPKINLYGEFYLGEYPWHPDLQEVGQWSSPEKDRRSRRSMSVPTRATVANYTCERSGYDYSIDRTVSVEIPAPWLANAMGLRLASGRSPIYVDASGKDVFFDPSVVEPGSAAALVDRDAFLQMLDHENLSAIWVIAGEKNAYGGRDASNGFGGCLLHTALYQLNSVGFSRHFHRDWVHPSQAQLAEFFGEEPVPTNIITRDKGLKRSPKKRAIEKLGKKGEE